MRRASIVERGGSIPNRTAYKAEQKLILMLPGPPDLRSRLVVRQLQLNALRDRAQKLDVELASGKVEMSKYTVEREKVANALTDCQFPPVLTTAVGVPSGFKRWRRELSTILKRDLNANDSINLPWTLPHSVRPVDVALAIGPRAHWWDNGIIAAKVGAILSTPATAYFSYMQTRDGREGAFNSYLGSLRLLSYVVWEIGFWVVAAFTLGCLWTTLPGRRGLTKASILWAGFAIPFVIGFVIGREVLHQLPFSGTGLHFPLLLLDLFLIGLALEWLTLRDVDTVRVYGWQFLVTLYGVRGLISTLAVTVPLLATLIGVYFQVKSGLSGPNIGPLPSGPPQPQPR